MIFSIYFLKVTGVKTRTEAGVIVGGSVSVNDFSFSDTVFSVKLLSKIEPQSKINYCPLMDCLVVFLCESNVQS